MSFIDDASKKALSESNVVDPSVEDWAGRAFSVIAVLGSMQNSGLDEAQLDALSTVLAKAPESVVASGTINVVLAQLQAEFPNPN